MGGGASSPASATYLAPIRAVGGALSRSGREPSDISVISFYPDIRAAFINFLRERQMQADFLLYEALNKLYSADSSTARTLIDEMRSSVLSKDVIQCTKLCRRSKDKLLYLSAMNFTNFTQGKLLGKVIDELEKNLSLEVTRFRSSAKFYECMRPSPTLMSLLAGRRLNMLMAISNDFVSTVLSKIMKERNFNIHHIVDGTTALADLMSNQYDVALLSLDLPDKSGISIVQDVVRLEDLCRKKIANYFRPLFIGMTAWGLENKKISAVRAGFTAVLPFPFPSSDFDAAMRVGHRIGSGTLIANNAS